MRNLLKIIPKGKVFFSELHTYPQKLSIGDGINISFIDYIYNNQLSLELFGQFSGIFQSFF
jgi:hypothetical protein